jgi:hypothetical protein
MARLVSDEPGKMTLGLPNPVKAKWDVVRIARFDDPAWCSVEARPAAWTRIVDQDERHRFVPPRLPWSIAGPI